MNLFSKIYLSFLSIIIFVLFIYGYINLNEQKQSYLKIIEAQSESIVKSYSMINIKPILANDKAQLISSSLDLLKDNSSVEYLIYDKKDGMKIFVSKDKFDVYSVLDEKFEKAKEENNFKIIKTNLYDKDAFVYSYKISISKYEWGWLHIGISLDEYHKQLKNIYDNFIFITIISILFSSILIYFIAKGLTTPIVELTKNVNKITNGEFKQIDVKNSTNDEIEQLKKDYNQMIKYLIESKNKEKFIYHQSKMAQMGEMLTNIAHQWRQPLSVITMGLSGIKLKKELDLLTDEDFEDNYDAIIESASYLTQTINTLSKYLNQNDVIEIVNISQLIKDISSLNEQTLNRNLVNLKLNINKDKIYEIKTFPNSLSHVLTNLLTNSCNAFEKNQINEKREITISLEENDDFVFLEIQDNAGGIDKNIIDNIFEPYSTTNEKFRGVGMGLYFSYDLVVNRIKGEIEVKNKDKGAFFIVKIPKNM